MAHSNNLPFTIIDNSHADDFETLSDDPPMWSPNAQHVHHHNHDHHHHNRDHAPSALRIRRHIPGSADPTLQQLPPVLEAPSSELGNLNVAIRRHPVGIQPDQNVVQPVFYPVPMPVYIQSPVQPFIQPYPISPDPDNRPIRPMANTSVYHNDAPPTQTPKTTKPFVPGKKRTLPSRPPPPPTDQYESETFEMPPSRIRTVAFSPRRPIRKDLLPTTPFGRPLRTEYVEVESYEDDDYHYETPSPVPVPKKVVTYRSVPGMTTRERENYEMSPPTRVVYVRAPRVETVTYRD